MDAILIEDLKPLFERAEREKLWFYISYQGLWFSPSELRQAQKDGKFCWGSINWDLRNPEEHVLELRSKIISIEDEILDFGKRMRTARG